MEQKSSTTKQKECYFCKASKYKVFNPPEVCLKRNHSHASEDGRIEVLENHCQFEQPPSYYLCKSCFEENNFDCYKCHLRKTFKEKALLEMSASNAPQQRTSSVRASNSLHQIAEKSIWFQPTADGDDDGFESPRASQNLNNSLPMDSGGTQIPNKSSFANIPRSTSK